MISARLPGGESLGLTSSDGDGDSSPLRDVQLISRAELAPFFAAANIVAALMMVAVLWGEVAVQWLLPWFGAVGLVNLAAMQMARNQAVTHVGRSGHRVPQWRMIGDVTVRAVLWISLPLAMFPWLQPNTQVIAASLMAGLGIGALGLVVVPPCVTAWMSVFTAGISGAMLIGRHTVPFQHMLSIMFTLGVAIFGVLAVARWSFQQLQANADFGSQSESASL
ncbi:MAG: hypothetical protein ABI422_00175, partial [Sphingomicrobium sp.]